MDDPAHPDEPQADGKHEHDNGNQQTPCSNSPSPGIKKLHSAATTLPLAALTPVLRPSSPDIPRKHLPCS